MGDDHEHAENWAETLASLLADEPKLQALRMDPQAKKISVAAVGPLDRGLLELRLSSAFSSIGDHLHDAGNIPAGFEVRSRGAVTEFSRAGADLTQVKWSDFEWPHDEEGDHDHGHHGESGWKTLGALAAICGAFGMAGFLVERLDHSPVYLSRVLYGVALVAGAWDAATDSIANLRRLKIDIHFLMLAVAIGAVCIGAWSEATLLLFLFSASEAMEGYALNRTQREVGSLLDSAPKTAHRLDEQGRESTIPVAEIAVGDTLRVRPGDAFPADGTVAQGQTACDESAITGEATPVEKAKGDQVFSGTINLWGVVDFAVRKLPSESTLQKIIRLIRTAQKLRSKSERFSDKFQGVYTYLVLGLSAVMFFVWWLWFHLPAFRNEPTVSSAFYRSMTLLVVASPCALVLSIPSAILAAIAWGAKRGVLFRGGAAIERLAEINTIALDKTGTLTTGELAVMSVESFPRGKETEVLELAYALELNSQHPLARAIVRHGEAQGIRALTTAGFESLTGQGVRGQVNGIETLLGRRELLEDTPHANLIKDLPLTPPELSEVWILGTDVVGRILLRDKIRPESKGVLRELNRSGITTVMLTGDRRHAADDVARELGVSDVRAGLTPEGKVAAIQGFRNQGRRVAMVGDGVNDAPSLAAADVAIAMGARGSDAALEQAEVILMNDRIENVLEAFQLSRRTRAVIRQNLSISLGVVTLMVLASLLTQVPLGLGVAAHEGSTVLVCLNSLRILLRPGEKSQTTGKGPSTAATVDLRAGA